MEDLAHSPCPPHPFWNKYFGEEKEGEHANLKSEAKSKRADPLPGRGSELDGGRDLTDLTLICLVSPPLPLTVPPSGQLRLPGSVSLLVVHPTRCP